MVTLVFHWHAPIAPMSITFLCPSVTPSFSNSPGVFILPYYDGLVINIKSKNDVPQHFLHVFCVTAMLTVARTLLDWKLEGILCM